MKYLISLVALLTMSCSSDDTLRQVEPGELRFHAGDGITVISGFYAGCKGTILGYHPYTWSVKGRYVHNYSVELNCRGTKITPDGQLDESSLDRSKNGKN